LRAYPDQDSARAYLEDRLWPNGPICPSCHAGDRLTQRKDGFRRCNACQLDFTLRTGTIFQRSHVPLHAWLGAMYLFPFYISSRKLAKEIGVTQKTAWFLLARLHEACASIASEQKNLKQKEVLDKIVDVVLAYRPPHKRPRPRKRKKQNRRKRADN
jgi:transposase-like protein